MPAVKLLRSGSVFSQAEWCNITQISSWRGVCLVVHAWSLSVAAAVLAAWWSNALGWVLAVIVIGGRQLGLAILMHEAAHGLLHPSRRINNILGQWVAGAAVGSDLFAYRSYHLRHHKFTQQSEDPDLLLSAPFPASRASLARKIIRDLTGQTFFKQRRAQCVLALAGLRAMAARRTATGTATGRGSDKNLKSNRENNKTRTSAFDRQSASGISAPAANIEDAIIVAKTMGRFLLVQFFLLAVSLILWGWTPWLLWIVSLATSFQFFLRIRNIAEHSCTMTGSDDPFSHARTTGANWLERLTFAPYWVNYHAEHHLFMAVPCYRLAQAHAALGRAGHHRRMTLEAGYLSVMQRVTT